MLTRWRAYKHAYSNNWQGIFVPRLRRGLYRKAAARLASAAPPNATILDIGTGPGHLLAILAEKLPDAALHGIDNNSHMVSAARLLTDTPDLAGRIAITEADAAALPFDESTFDCVVSMMSYHLWDDQPAGLAEARRVLKPGGTLHLYVGRTQGYPGRWAHLEIFNHATEEALRMALESAGFASVDMNRAETYVFASATR